MMVTFFMILQVLFSAKAGATFWAKGFSHVSWIHYSLWNICHTFHIHMNAGQYEWPHEEEIHLSFWIVCDKIRMKTDTSSNYYFFCVCVNIYLSFSPESLSTLTTNIRTFTSVDLPVVITIYFQSRASSTNITIMFPHTFFSFFNMAI